MTDKPKALLLAEKLEQQFPIGTAQHYLDGEAATELRRLHEEVEWMKKNMSNVSRVEQSLIAANTHLHEVNAELLEALKLALSAHGKVLLSDPPQDAWKTYCKAKSFDFAVKNAKKSDVLKVGMPFTASPNTKEILWK